MKQNHSSKACWYHIDTNENTNGIKHHTANEGVLERNDAQMIDSKDNKDKMVEDEVKETNQEYIKLPKNGELYEKKNEALQLQSCNVNEDIKDTSNGSQQSIPITWINKILEKTFSFLPRYKSYYEFKDGKAIKSLLAIYSGHDPDWFYHNAEPWKDIDMFLSGLEYDFDISALKRGRKQEVIKFVNWIKEDVEHEVKTRKFEDYSKPSQL